MEAKIQNKTSGSRAQLNTDGGVCSLPPLATPGGKSLGCMAPKYKN